MSTVWRRVPARIRRWGVRATNTTFTVTAAAIVQNDEGNVLLLKHRYRPGSGWGIPGGFLELGEQPEQTLRRELREEIDLELNDVRLFTVRTFKRQKQIEVVFVARASGSTQPQSGEIESAEWFSRNSLPDGLPSDQKKLIHSVLVDGAKGRV